MIIIKNLTKKYDKITALNNVNLIFQNKKVTAIMGENGAGKSTLLKICSGVISFDSGEIIIDEYSIINKSIQALTHIGYLPEMPYMYDRLTGREFLFYIGSIRKIRDTEKKINDLSNILDINDFLDYELGSYSKGMKQKISLISSMIHEPNNLLLDEPVWGLDPLTSKTLKKFIKDRNGTTVIATHSPQLVEQVANEVYFLRKGKIVSYGGVEKYIEKYVTIEEAYFSETE
ncbi:ABC transporter ATP-binding protein [Thermoplasmatota archaeon]